LEDSELSPTVHQKLSLSPEEIYARLRALVEEMREFDFVNGPIPIEMHQWLGRAVAVIGLIDPVAAVQLQFHAKELHGYLGHKKSHAIAAIVYQAFGKAELNAPAAVKGTFIPAGHTFTAFTAVGNVLKTAKTGILIVDPYIDETVLSEYVTLAPESVTVRLLTEANYKRSLKPAAERWVQQFGAKRPLHLRLATMKLHDREIFIDGAKAWNVGQSLKDLAKKSHTGLSQHDEELGARKIAAYQDIWDASTPL
jgi:hypothetical protein